MRSVRTSRRLTSGVSADRPLPREWSDRVGVSAPNLIRGVRSTDQDLRPYWCLDVPARVVRFDEVIF
ncbi:MAG: hypothetical protein CL419_11735 [Acidimicrobiaceae bacterium]|nr:hypothetical protein [Acidimicrobiaceae bacterium]